MKLYLAAASILGLIFIASTGAAIENDVSSAQYIMKGCEILAFHVEDSSVWAHMDSDTKRQVWMCAGALAATAQIMTIRHDFCPKPDDNKNYNNLPIIANYMRSHPDKLHYGMGFVIFMALKEAWPCPREQ